jgi:hypothetical protein
MSGKFFVAALFACLAPFLLGMGSIIRTSISDDAQCQQVQKIAGQRIVIRVKCPKTEDFSGNGSVENRSKSKTVSHGPKLRYSVRYYSECTPDMSMRLGCDAIAEPTCEDGGWQTIRVVSAVNGPRAGRVISLSTYCSLEPPMDIPGAEQDVARVTPEQFRKLSILASTIVSQPESFSLRNGHAHMYALSESQNFAVTIFDQNVRVRAIPVTFLWAYGDGVNRSFSFPGQPMAQRGFDEPTTTSHVYTETGDFAVGLTTRFRGEYSTEGGPWTPIPGVANVPSEQITMSVWRTKKILVAENCNEGARTPGCASLFE